MRTSILSDLQTIDVFQDPAVFSVSFAKTTNKILHVLLHLFPARPCSSFVGKRDPVVSSLIVPLDQSPEISDPLPLILFLYLFRSGLSLLLSLLTGSSISSCVFFLYFNGIPTIPSLPDLPAYCLVSHMPLRRNSNTLYQDTKRGFALPDLEKRVKNIAGISCLSLDNQALYDILNPDVFSYST